MQRLRRVTEEHQWRNVVANKIAAIVVIVIAPAAQSYEERIAQGLVPQKRMGEPADVARAVRAIADGWLDYSTGQVIDVDGGFHVRGL